MIKAKPKVQDDRLDDRVYEVYTRMIAIGELAELCESALKLIGRRRSMQNLAACSIENIDSHILVRLQPSRCVWVVQCAVDRQLMQVQNAFWHELFV